MLNKRTDCKEQYRWEWCRWWAKYSDRLTACELVEYLYRVDQWVEGNSWVYSWSVYNIAYRHQVRHNWSVHMQYSIIDAYQEVRHTPNLPIKIIFILLAQPHRKIWRSNTQHKWLIPWFMVVLSLYCKFSIESTRANPTIDEAIIYAAPKSHRLLQYSEDSQCVPNY